MIAEYADIRHALQALIDGRRARIRSNALVLIAIGRIIVYADVGWWRTFGTFATLAGMMMLAFMVGCEWTKDDLLMFLVDRGSRGPCIRG